VATSPAAPYRVIFRQDRRVTGYRATVFAAGYKLADTTSDRRSARTPLLTITASRTPPAQSPGDENPRADSIGPMLLGHRHAKSETISVRLRPLR